METGNKYSGSESTFHPVKPSLSLIDDTVNDDILSSCHLSILITNHSLSTAVLDVLNNHYLILETYKFQATDTDILTGQVEHIISGSDHHNQPFRSVSGVVTQSVSTLIPAPLFDESKMTEYLRFNHTIEETGNVVSDVMQSADARTIYSIPTVLEDGMKKLFPKIKLRHFSTTMIESLLILNKNQAEKSVYLHIQPAQFEVIIIKGKELLFYNSFKHETKEDIVYYLLFVCEQLDVNPDNVNMTVFGELLKSAEIINFIKKYVRNVFFGERPTGFSYSSKFDEIPGHHHFNLFNQYLCVS